MILYHGSNTDFDIIDLSKCLPNKDFGKGFYLTPSKHDASLRAKDKCNKELCGVPTIQRYLWNDTNTDDLQIKKFDKVDEQWAKFILNNRNRKGCGHQYDIVIGPVADDGLVLSLQLYEIGMLTIAELSKRLAYAKPYIQYCFCTQKAINMLKRI